MPWRDEISIRFPSPQQDEPANLRQDILDEIEDHLSCAMKREMRRTEDPATASRVVLKRFGDPARLARRLWLDAMKGRLMNQRILIGTNIVLAAVTITMCVIVLFALRENIRSQEAVVAQLQESVNELAIERAATNRDGGGSRVAMANGEEPPESDSQQERADLREQWAARLPTLGDNWRVAYAAGNELVQLPPDEGFAILRDNWDRIEHVSSRQQIIKAFAFSAMSDMHPHIIDVMHLGMTDESSEVQAWAIGYLRWMAFEDYAKNFSAYDEWRARHEGKSAEQIMIDDMKDWTQRLQAGDPDARALLREGNMLALRDQPWMRETARKSDLPEVLATIIEEGADHRAGRRAREEAKGAIRRVREMRPYEAYLRRVVLPIITADSPNDDLLSDAYIALQGPENAWARDVVLDRLARTVLSRDRRAGGHIFIMAQTIASYNDPSVIPTLIKLIDFDNTYNTIYGIGYFGLGPLTGVSYDESHDGAWWREWWENNNERFPEEVRDLPIPNVDPDDEDVPATHTRGGDDGVRHAGGDGNKAYFLIGEGNNDAAAPEGGYKLMLVLPGGDGGADFHPFVRNIHANALGDEWLVAQLIAPVWEPDNPNRIVWPNRQLRAGAMAFPTEDFIKAVVDDVKKHAPIDENHIYALGWSSGGPTAYAAAMAADSPLTGAFVAMSVFHRQNVPEVDELKTKRFYILHSPEDFIQMRFPEAARDTLEGLGATVHLEEYAGGHGWHGDVFGMIRDGAQWLVDQKPARQVN